MDADIAMPVVALFHGIRILLYWDDHGPPHFRAEYAEHAAKVDIRRGVVIAGYLPRRQLRLVLAWAQLHEDELMQNWELARDKHPLRSIQGLM